MPSLILPVRTIVHATPRTRIIVAALGSHAFPFRAGQAVFAGLAGGEVRRPYSIACSPAQSHRDNALEFLVQTDDHSVPDPHLDRATPGTRLSIEGPFGSLGLPLPLLERRLLLIAGGTGIAPLRSIMWHTLEHEPGVRVGVVYSARSPAELAYYHELASLGAEGRLDLAVTVTRTGNASWTGPTGRIDRALIESVLDTPETRCAICGPPGLVADASALLLAAGIRPDRILTET